MLVHIIRHTSVDVPKGMCYGQTDVPLRPTFEAEAAEVKAQLQGKTFQRVYTSPLSRCVRLATYCGYRNAERDPRLKELNFGEWEWTMLYDLDHPEVKHWFANQITQPTKGGESILQLKERFHDFIREKKKEGLENIALFAHGGILLSAMMIKGKTFDNDIFLHLPPYGSILEFTF